MLVYGFLFTFLLLSNIFTVTKIQNLSNREETIQNILTEIDSENPSSDQFSYSNAPFTLQPYTIETKLADGRVANLKAFFRKHGSDLYDHAEYLVRVADEYKLDYRLLPAIAMQESNLCKKIPIDSYNCWGWGIYGTTVTRFSSYEEAISTVAKGLKKHYIDKGLVTASKIMEKYTPSSRGSWAFAVNKFLRELEM